MNNTTADIDKPKLQRYIKSLNLPDGSIYWLYREAGLLQVFFPPYANKDVKMYKVDIKEVLK